MTDTLPMLPARVTLEAAHWHVRQREGGLDQAQQAAFMDWLTASPDHLREYLAVARSAAELLAALREAPATATMPRDNVVVLPVRRSTPICVRAAGAHPSRAPRRVALVASLAVCAGIATLLTWPRTAHYAADHGQPRHVTLPDGSNVHLNAESELALRYTLLQRRLVLLRGQASFTVAEDRRPLVVHAAGLQVRDIGTTFDVSLHREQARIDVAEGRVLVTRVGGDDHLLADLHAGQSARIGYRDLAVRVSREDVDAMTAWWHGRVVFRDESLQDVADRFNRINRTQLRVTDAAAGTLRMTGNLRGDDLLSLRAFLDDQPGLVTTVAANEIRVGSRIAPGGARAY